MLKQSETWKKLWQYTGYNEIYWYKMRLFVFIILLASTAQGQWWTEHPPGFGTESYQSCAEILTVGCIIPTTATLLWTHYAKPQSDNEKVLAGILPHLATAGIAWACWRDNKSLTDNDMRWVNPVMLMGVSVIGNVIWMAIRH